MNNENNINSTIDRFNGKYLKCVVSKYKSILKYLANSGAMIILQQTEKSNESNNESKDIRNYIYLGDEFLASGYGFIKKEIRDEAEKFILEYDDRKQAFHDEIEEEYKEYINQELDDYVEKDGGDVTNTIIYANAANKAIPLKNILLETTPYIYKDFNIDYLNIIFNDGDNVKNNNIELYNINNSNSANLEKTIYIPFGNTLETITYEIKYSNNDTYGIYNDPIINSYDEHENPIDENPINAIEIKYDNQSYIFKLIGKTINANNNNVSYKYKIDGDQKIQITKATPIQQIFKLHIKGTQWDDNDNSKLQYYTNLVDTDGNKIEGIASREYIIDDYDLSFNININVKPQYYFIYGYAISNGTDSINTVAQLNIDDMLTQIRIPVGYPTDNNVYFGIPGNFVLQSLYTVNNRERYNVIGACQESKTENIYINCPLSTANNIKINYIYYKFNAQNIKDNQTTNNIFFELTIKRVKDNADTSNNASINIDKIKFDYITYDEEFNNLYWINCRNLNATNIKTKLEDFNRKYF